MHKAQLIYINLYFPPGCPNANTPAPPKKKGKEKENENPRAFVLRLSSYNNNYYHTTVEVV